MKIGIQFLGAIYHLHEGETGLYYYSNKHRIRRPVEGCADFCRKLKEQRHNIVVFYDARNCSLDISQIWFYLRYHKIPCDQVKNITAKNRHNFFFMLDLYLTPESIFNSDFMVSISKQSGLYRCASDLIGNSAGEWSEQQVAWFNALFAEELRVSVNANTQ